MSGYEISTYLKAEADHRLRPKGAGPHVRCTGDPSDNVTASADQEELNKLQSYVGVLKKILNDHNTSTLRLCKLWFCCVFGFAVDLNFRFQGLNHFPIFLHHVSHFTHLKDCIFRNAPPYSGYNFRNLCLFCSKWILHICDLSAWNAPYNLCTCKMQVYRTANCSKSPHERIEVATLTIPLQKNLSLFPVILISQTL